MPGDLVLATFSDRLFMGAVAVYVLAMLAHAAQYVRTDVAAAVSTGRGSVATLERRPAPPRRFDAPRLGRTAVALTTLGALVHLASIAARGVSAHRWPLGNMYEFSAAISLFAVTTWLVAVRHTPALRRFGVLALAPVLMLMFLAGTVLYAQAAPVMPALQSFWLVIHVTTVALSSGLLVVAGMASAAFLLHRSTRFATLVEKLPSADALDRLAYRITVVAFPIYTFAVVAGGIWAEAAWGRFWGWDPKETVAFIVWVSYAAYLHARATSGWRASRAAWINVVGLAAIGFNLFFVNLVVAGLHSYAGLPG